MISPSLAETLVVFATTLVSDYTAAGALDDLMRAVPKELDVDGAGIMLCDDNDDLRFVSASDETVRLIEQFQIEAGEGPCVLAALTGQTVFTDDLQTVDPRFPVFSRRAYAAGLRSVHSFPMRIEQDRFGAMNLYRAKPGLLSAGSIEAGRIFADMSTSYLMSARRIDDATRMTDQLRAALNRSGPIEQAKGYLAHARDTSPAGAFESLRAHARASREPLLGVCERLLAGDLRAEDLPD